MAGTGLRRLAAPLLLGALALVVAAVAPAACAAAQARGQATRRSRTDATVWLCRPGLVHDPCTRNLDTTVVTADGTRTTETRSPAPSTSFDCFYVYPTVSTEQAANANLEIQQSEIAAARAQASPFSELCHVWAPMYRQTTLRTLLQGLGHISAHEDAVAYDSLLSAWRDFLRHDDKGHPIILIGHSQGAAVLIRLLAREVDGTAARRSRILLAILAGGNLQVPDGEVEGATFKHIALCTAAGETGCAIAYSSFPSEPPATSPFGRPGSPVSRQSGQTAIAGQEVACVNPAALGGGTGELEPLFLSAQFAQLSPPVGTPWVTFPDLYTASCESGGGATWLQVNDAAGPGDHRPVVTEALGPTWGYHVDDVNLVLGNLLADVAAAEQHYDSAHPRVSPPVTDGSP